MVIYEKVNRFNRITGKPEDEWVFKEIRCDFTGQLLTYENQYCTYQLDYEDQDPCFGSSGEEYNFGEKYKVGVWAFLNQKYHFSVETDYYYAEAEMMQLALKNCEDERSVWHRCYTFDAMCRQARIEAATKLIEDGVIKPEQLSQGE